MPRLSAYYAKPKLLKQKVDARQTRKSNSCNSFNSNKNLNSRDKMIFSELDLLKKKKRHVAKSRKRKKLEPNHYPKRMKLTEYSMKRKRPLANRSWKKRRLG